MRIEPVRAFVQDDVREVAELLFRVLHRRERASPPVLESYLREVFFQSPWRNEDMPSLVYQNARGKVIGFLGVVSRPMSLRGRPIRVAFGSNFVVDPTSHLPLASLHLVRAFLAGRQDLSIADSANDRSRTILTGLGYRTVFLQSIYWSRPLRPCLYGLYMLSRLKSEHFPGYLTSALKPLCGMADAVSGKLPGNPFRPRASKISAEPADIAVLLECFREFSGAHLLLPEYDNNSLRWLLDFMSGMRAYGDLRKMVLRDSNQTIVGFYLYCVEAGGVAQVVRMGAKEEFIGELLNHLFHDAWAHGAIALHGRLDPQFTGDLCSRFSFFFRRGDWVLAHSHQRDLLQLVQSGNALLTRLEGEWSLRFGADGGSPSA